MKRYTINFWTRISTMVLAGLMIASCSNLDEDPDEAQVNPATLNSAEALEAVLTGMYRNLMDGAKDTEFQISAFGGDDITTHSASNKIAFRESDWRRMTHSSARTIATYKTLYNVITLANIAIEAQANIVSKDQAKVDRLIGEAYFLRAFSYMHATKTFGRVPLQLVPNSNESLPRASFLELYTQIESDFQKAELLLPVKFPGIPVVGSRPNKGTAAAFMSRLYLMWGGYPIKDASKYALAASKAKEVIDNAVAYGYGLATNFRGLWTVANRFNQNEGVFTLVSCVPCGVHNRTMGRLGLPSEAGGWTETFGEIAFYEDMLVDATANGTLKRFNDTYILEQMPMGQKPIGSEWMTWSDPHLVLRKIVGGDMTEPGSNNTLADFNIYFMRYAEVLLNYAEATGRAGGNDAAAWDALNQVRMRAGATTTLTDADGSLTDLAFTERKWEFAGEFLRMHDLVRTEKLSEALANRSPMETVDIKNNIVPVTSGGEEFYFTPIPQEQLDIDPGLGN